MLCFVNIIWAQNIIMFTFKTKTGEKTKTKQKHDKRHTECVTPSHCCVYSNILTPTGEEIVEMPV